MTDHQAIAVRDKLEAAPLVSDVEIDALVAKGWDWHSAYRHLQGGAHASAILSTKENTHVE